MFRINGRQYKYQISQNYNEIVEENCYRLVLGEKDADGRIKNIYAKHVLDDGMMVEISVRVIDVT